MRTFVYVGIIQIRNFRWLQFASLDIFISVVESAVER